MHRTQIYLDDIIYNYLEEEKKRSKLSFSEIIRNNIKLNIKKKSEKIIDSLEQAIGGFSDNISPEKYVNSIRKDRKL